MPYATEVLDWFDANARELPWREANRSPWGVLVSEIMLQQTPVARVSRAWVQWMERWPRPSDLANASPAEVIRAWQRLGYPRRALRLRDSATIIRDQHGDQVPDTYGELIALPGIGDYTAAAVLAFAFTQRSVVLDTNVRRVVARAFGGTEFPGSASATKPERALAESVLPTEPTDAARWSVALMEIGAVLCRSTSTECTACPLQTRCQWRIAGYPKSEVARKAQKFKGTDRQVRGLIMAVLRETDGPVPRQRIDLVWRATIQRNRALDSLVTDGLVEPIGDTLFALPSR